MTATIDHTEETPGVPSGACAAVAPPDAPRRPVRYGSDPSPWRRRDAAVCGLLGVLGVVGITACWFGATEEVVWRDQTGWLTGAILCTGPFLVGGGLWILIGMRRVRQGFRDLRRDQRAALGLTRVRGAGDVAEPVADGVLVTSGQMTRVHRADCLLLRGKQATPVATADLEKYNRCGVCGS